MKELIESVKKLIEDETRRCDIVSGYTMNSNHETFAYILEEVQESAIEMDGVQKELNEFWNHISRDTGYGHTNLETIQRRAILGACELIQVAQLARKGMLTWEGIEKNANKQQTEG